MLHFWNASNVVWSHAVDGTKFVFLPELELDTDVPGGI